MVDEFYPSLFGGWGVSPPFPPAPYPRPESSRWCDNHLLYNRWDGLEWQNEKVGCRDHFHSTKSHRDGTMLLPNSRLWTLLVRWNRYIYDNSYKHWRQVQIVGKPRWSCPRNDGFFKSSLFSPSWKKICDGLRWYPITLNCIPQAILSKWKEVGGDESD